MIKMIGWFVCKMLGTHDFEKNGEPQLSTRENLKGVIETPIKCKRCSTVWTELSVPSVEEK